MGCDFNRSIRHKKARTRRAFATGAGPGKAAIKSVTRDGGTWILQVAISDGGWIQNRKAVLYIDAESAMVSEVAPEPKPEQVAAQ